jgi:alkylhydroperoxidase family enzyme
MSDPRIPLLCETDAKAAAASIGVSESIAELNVFRLLLRDPPVAKSVNDLLMTMLFRGKLDTRLRELVIMRIGWVTGSVYEWTQHWRVALALGVSEEDLLRVREGAAANGWSDADRAVLRATDEVLSSGLVSPATWALCEEALGSDEERVELVIAIGTWNLISQFLRSLEVPLEDGVMAWPPDGKSPPKARSGNGGASA